MPPRWGLLAACLTLTLAMYFVAWNRESLYLLAVTSTLLGIVLAGLLLPWIAARSTRLDLALPEENAPAGSAMEMTLFSRNFWLWPHDGLLLALRIKAGPATAVAGERLLALPRLWPGRQQHRLHTAAFPRGRYRLADSTLQSRQPFGLWNFQRPAGLADREIVIRPRRFPVPVRRWLEGSAFSHPGQQLQHRAGFSSEFFSVREYRPGDSPRHVDWKASARQGELIVREFENNALPPLLVAIDSHVDLSADQSRLAAFEDCVSLVASACTAALRAGLAVELRSQNLQVAASTGDLQERRLLEALTDIHATATLPLHLQLKPLLLPEAVPRSLLLVVSSQVRGWKDLGKLLPQLAQRGHRIDLVAVAFAEEEKAAVQALRPCCRDIALLGSRPLEQLLA